MGDELGSRIRSVRDDAGMTRKEFSEKLGLTPNNIYMIETGRRGISPAISREICRQFSVRDQWLENGEGEMHRDLSPAMEAADRVRRLLIDAPASTAGVVISALVELDPSGPEWVAIGSLLKSIADKLN